MPSLSEIDAIADQKERTQKYKEFITAADAAALVQACAHLVNPDVPLVVSRPVLEHYAAKVVSLTGAALKGAARESIEIIKPKVVSFEAQFAQISEAYANALEAEGAFGEAADVLAAIPLDSGQRALAEEEKSAMYVRVASNFLKVGNWAAADKALNRASALKRDAEVSNTFKRCFTAVLDYKQRYLEAAQGYYDASRQAGLAPAAVDDMLASALVCTMLADAGHLRSRLAAIMYKDDRCAKQPGLPLLDYVVFERIIRPEQTAKFVTLCKPHHLEKAGEFNSAERAIVQHNLLAAAKVYKNISFAQLGALLGISPEAAETFAAKMILAKELNASIDQLEGTVTFLESANVLGVWDEQIEGVCQTVDRVITLLQRDHDSYVKSV